MQEHGILSIKYAQLREDSAAAACSMHYAEMEMLSRLCAIIVSSSDANAHSMLQELAWRDDRIETTLKKLKEAQ